MAGETRRIHVNWLGEPLFPYNELYACGKTRTGKCLTLYFNSIDIGYTGRNEEPIYDEISTYYSSADSKQGPVSEKLLKQMVIDANTGYRMRKAMGDIQNDRTSYSSLSQGASVKSTNLFSSEIVYITSTGNILTTKAAVAAAWLDVYVARLDTSLEFKEHLDTLLEELSRLMRMGLDSGRIKGD